ncbi:MAG: hypothetical protein HUU57_10490 [Bdellovibrio sp.]|nr:hypothetical protein [Bdellovibrio sp.]
MKIKVFVFFVCFLSTSVFASWEVQNGGGGVVSQGTYMTFHSAQIPIGTTSLDLVEIPGISYLLQKVTSMPIGQESKMKLLKMIFPSERRKYYRVPEDQLDENLKRSLISIYANLANIPEDRVALFAMTHREAERTVLLPAFYQLTEVEQAAILLHEALWTYNYQLTYEQVVGVEQVAQAYFMDTHDASRYFQFYSSLGKVLEDRSLLFVASVAFEQKDNLSKLEKNSLGHIRLESLFGKQFLMCLATSAGRNYLIENKAEQCKSILLNDLIVRSLENPESLVFKGMIHYLQEKGIFFLRYTQINWTIEKVTRYFVEPYLQLHSEPEFLLYDEQKNVRGSLSF